MRKRKVIQIVLFICLTVTGCTIQPKVELVSGQTALERQLLGRFAELDQKAMLVTPVRRADKVERVATAYERAVAGRAFRFDEIEGWIRQGWLVEVDDGTIRQRHGANIRLPGKLKQRFKHLIRQENADRAAIIEDVIHHSADFHESDRSSLAALFHRLRVRELPAGAWIQTQGRNFQKHP